MQQPKARLGQLLTIHLTNVGNDTGKYLAAIDGSIELGKLTGYLHDLGKFAPAWQEYLHQSNAGTLDAPFAQRSAGKERLRQRTFLLDAFDLSQLSLLMMSTALCLNPTFRTSTFTTCIGHEDSTV